MNCRRLRKKFQTVLKSDDTARRLVEIRCRECLPYGTSLTTGEPAVRPQGQRVRNRMRAFRSKSRQQNLRIRIRNVVAVFVGIKKKIGKLQNENSAVTKRQTAREIQSADKILGASSAPHFIEVLQNGDAIGAFRSAWQWFGNFVVTFPREPIHLRAIQSRRIWVLQILNDPEAP